MTIYPWPPAPPAWLLPWVIWRFKGAVPPDRPATAPKEIPKWAQGFLQWCAWKRKGEIGLRPAVPAKVQQWSFGILKQLNIAVPLAPPPPPPPPAPPIAATSWDLRMPIMYTSHGWLLDTSWRDNDSKLRQMADAGVGTVALQGGMFLPDTGDRCRDYGFDVAVWGRADSRDPDYLELADAQGYIPQIEGKYEYDAAIANLRAGVGEGLSLSVVTTNAGFDHFIARPDGKGGFEDSTEEYEALESVGCTHAQVECYWADMSPIPVPQMVSNTDHRGFHHITPVLSYLDIKTTAYGRQVAVFLGEPMSDDQWRWLKAM